MVERKNGFNEWVECEEKTCAACKYYQLKDERKKNECELDHRDYWPDDYCRDYEVYKDCFLTTACCTYKGLPDDCYELQMLRNFRDSVLKKTETGTALVQLYYEQAPKIVEQIDRLSEEKHRSMLDWLYQEISQVAALIEEDAEKHFDEIVERYLLVTLRAERKLSAEE